MMIVNIFDLINAKEIGIFWTNLASNKIPYLGVTLFPSLKQLGLDLKWFKGSKGLPIALKPAAFDTKTTIRDRIGVTKVETEMPFFREGMRIGEKERQELNKALGSSNSAFIMPIINQIYNDAANLIDGALVNPERMIMQLLSTGLIGITTVTDGVRVAYNYDYKFDATHKETLLTTDLWSAVDTATPIQDIQRWQDKIEEDTGTRPPRAICTRATWNNLMLNKSIKLDMNPIGGTNVILTDSMLQQYLLAKLGLTVAVYNKKYKNGAGSTIQFFPDDKFTLIPDGTLGNTYFGTTPEESDLMSGATNAQVQIVNTGIAVTTWKEVDPVNVLTKVSEIVLPSFEAIDQVFIATVA
jgi:hypothetical protein